MAWVTPSAQVTGDIITAAIWNQNVVSNALLLKTSITDGGNLIRPVIQVTTSTGADYAHDIATDVILVTAGDVTVLLASTTSSSTGRFLDLKNAGSGTVRFKAVTPGIDGTTSTSAFSALSSGESMTFFRTPQTCGVGWGII